MGYLKIVGGAVIGVSAIAAAPFTGGGSVLAATGLLGSLAGAGTIAVATGAAAAGAAVGGALTSKEKKDIQKKYTILSLRCMPSVWQQPMQMDMFLKKRLKR